MGPLCSGKFAMGDMMTEPSMEEILSSIKRIIAEEGDGPASPRSRRSPSRPATTAIATVPAAPREEVLELSDAVSEEADLPTVEEATARIDTILSERTAQASRGALETLSRMVVKPETPGSDTLEGLVRDMLRPMLSEWLDANLPEIVEKMVAREISRITSRS